MCVSTRSRSAIRRTEVADPAVKVAMIWRAGAFVVPALTLLAGCSAMIAVQVSGPLEQPVVRFGNDPAQTEKVCVSALSVEELPYGRAAVVWSLETVDGGCRRLEQIVYGQVPEGFKTVVEAVPLRAGVRYSVTASGQTGGLVTRVPWRGGGDYIFENGAWRPADRGQTQP